MNIKNVHNKIRELEHKYQLQPGAVMLLAVSKTRTCDEINKALKTGQLDFGENYLQEALSKIRYFNDPKIRWHFIGPIQSNKTQDIAKNFTWAHSVDREKIAERLNKQRPEGSLPLNICLQINISQETSKSGLSVENALDFANKFNRWRNLKLRGLMTLPLPGAQFELQASQFRKLAQLYKFLRSAGHPLDTLSMGTSADMEAAIAEGATIVRIGTAIFGAR